MLASAVWLYWPAPHRVSADAIQHDVYVWQRAWTKAVTNAVATHGTNFGQIAALKTEVRWKGSQPEITRVAVDYRALRDAGASIALALRIGPYSGPFAANDSVTRLLAGLSAEIVAEAASNGLTLDELQIDFDCAESKLAGYRLWIDAIRGRVEPTPVTITALPSWLKQRSFRRLIEASDGYLLQVHSFAPPAKPDGQFTLCEPREARRAVEKAARLGTPFRVALPTYGYLAAFDPSGRFLGISAEGPQPLWATNVILREMRADSSAIAGVVREWSEQRPAQMTGIIWYRLPIAGERLNWPWEALSMVLAGRVPHSDLRAEARSASPALVEVELFNAGTADHVSPVTVALQWRKGWVVSSDGLAGFESVDAGPQAIEFRRNGPLPQLGPGKRRMVGWVRFDQETEVQVECKRTE